MSVDSDVIRRCVASSACQPRNLGQISLVGFPYGDAIGLRVDHNRLVKWECS
jgi:hypothetical protein